MRRTAALLSLPLYLTTRGVLRCWLPPPLGIDPMFLLPLYLVLPPCLIVLASVVGRDHVIRRVLQVIGSLGMVAVWAWLALQGDGLLFESVLDVTFLGMTAISLAEAAVFTRRAPTSDPERRLTLALLILIPADVALAIAYELRGLFDPDILSVPGIQDWIKALGTSIGLGCVFLLAAWGLVRDRRWTLWVALAASVAHVVAETVLWATGRMLPAYYYLTEAFPGHLVLATLAVLFVRRLRRVNEMTASDR